MRAFTGGTVIRKIAFVSRDDDESAILLSSFFVLVLSAPITYIHNSSATYELLRKWKPGKRKSTHPHWNSYSEDEVQRDITYL